jgi:hypothetical protein
MKRKQRGSTEQASLGKAKAAKSFPKSKPGGEGTKLLTLNAGEVC